MNVSTMAAINSINTMNLMMALQLEVNTIFVVNDGKEYEEMSTLLEQFSMGKTLIIRNTAEAETRQFCNPN